MTINEVAWHQVIFVEWNPVPGKPLADLIRPMIPKMENRTIPIRIITVPSGTYPHWSLRMVL